MYQDRIVLFEFKTQRDSSKDAIEVFVAFAHNVNFDLGQISSCSFPV